MSAVPSPVHADFVIELFGDGIPRVDQVAFRLGIADDEDDASEPVSQDFETVSFFNVSVDGSHHFTSPSASAGRVLSAVSVGVLVGAAEKLSPPFSPRMLVSAV